MARFSIGLKLGPVAEQVRREDTCYDPRTPFTTTLMVDSIAFSNQLVWLDFFAHAKDPARLVNATGNPEMPHASLYVNRFPIKQIEERAQ